MSTQNKLHKIVIPEVSVIIPAYNTETYIAKAIESALGQTEKNIEVIVVDDASTDRTVEVVRSFTDKRLKLLINPKNLGAGGARNLALRESKGRWVAVLDSDDWYAPERLEKLLSVAYAEDADMIADDLYFIRDGEQSPWTTMIRRSGEQIDKIQQINSVYFVETDVLGQRCLGLGFSKPLFKRDFLVKHGIEYDEPIRMGQDHLFYLKCLVSGARFFLLPEAYYFYRARPNSLVRQSLLERLNYYLQASLDFLQQESVKKNPQLVNALSKKHKVISQRRANYLKIMAFYRVVEPLKRGSLLTALIEMGRNPDCFLGFLKRKSVPPWWRARAISEAKTAIKSLDQKSN